MKYILATSMKINGTLRELSKHWQHCLWFNFVLHGIKRNQWRQNLDFWPRHALASSDPLPHRPISASPLESESLFCLHLRIIFSYHFHVQSPVFFITRALWLELIICCCGGWSSWHSGLSRRWGRLGCSPTVAGFYCFVLCRLFSLFV